MVYIINDIFILKSLRIFLVDVNIEKSVEGHTGLCLIDLNYK